ncbi:MAG TPA: DUF3857 domain-containing protein, partial [Puia sp.]|nr:DUF3857 domain-containing protein [Puia sp.]
MRFFLWMLFSAFCLQGFGQSFNTAAIPDSLKRHAKAVVTYSERIYEIKSPGKARLQERHVYTILDESANEYGRYRSYYDKFTSITSISARLFDASGHEIRHAKRKDMQDVAGDGDESLVSDTRYLLHDFYWKTYPYTVEYAEEDDINGILGIDGWYPQGSPDLSVLYNKYVIITPSDYVLRYRAYNGCAAPVITESGGKKTYTWEIKNVPAVINEQHVSSWEQAAPYTRIAPSDFEIEGYKGNMSSWENYGKFTYALLQGRDVLPAQIKSKVHELTDPLQDPKQKIAALYEYLQKNTRYISIQLGIGGWQPFDASYVATKRYGDCKALSNYMVALLKEAGIKANSVLIKSGLYEGLPDKSFPCHQFDHVICCVPLQKDTVWLECTDQYLPAGYLSGFTSDRYGLIVDASGGKLARTPKYGLKENLQRRKVNAEVGENGNLTVNVATQYCAMKQDDLTAVINHHSKDQVLEYLKNEIELPTFDITKVDYKQEKDVLPPVLDETLSITASNYAQVSGKRIFVNPNIMTRFDSRLPTETDRKSGVTLYREGRDIDTVEVKIPVG